MPRGLGWPFQQCAERFVILGDLAQVFDCEGTDHARSQIAAVERDAAAEGFGVLFHVGQYTAAGSGYPVNRFTPSATIFAFELGARFVRAVPRQ